MPDASATSRKMRPRALAGSVAATVSAIAMSASMGPSSTESPSPGFQAMVAGRTSEMRIALSIGEPYLTRCCESAGTPLRDELRETPPAVLHRALLGVVVD